MFNKKSKKISRLQTQVSNERRTANENLKTAESHRIRSQELQFSNIRLQGRLQNFERMNKVFEELLYEAVDFLSEAEREIRILKGKVARKNVKPLKTLDQKMDEFDKSLNRHPSSRLKGGKHRKVNHDL